MLEDRRLEPQTEYTHCDNCDCTIDVNECLVLDDVYLCKDCAIDIDVLITQINENSKIDGYQVVEMLELLKRDF